MQSLQFSDVGTNFSELVYLSSMLLYCLSARLLNMFCLGGVLIPREATSRFVFHHLGANMLSAKHFEVPAL